MAGIVSDSFIDILARHGYLEKLYASLKDPDCVEPTLTAHNILKETQTMRKFDRKWKISKDSTLFREEGNKAYVAGKYQTALLYYNQALLHAPIKSNAMLLAYSNRSALLLKTKNFSACLQDIETCLTLDCNNDILEKLLKRKKDCKENLWREKCRFSMFSDNFFKLNVKRHPHIPCATNDVKIVIDPETQLPKVVAAKDIQVGTVIAVDTAFTTLLNPLNYYFCCYYCNKMSLNLIPCSTCTYALFCNKDCRERCSKESHNLECSIMDMFLGGFCGPYSRLAFRTVVKIKQMCDTWKEFVDASHSIGTERMRNSPVDQIYDGNHKFSMLSFVELREIKNGAKFNFAFLSATFLEQLINTPFFLPNKPDKKDEAIHALVRMTMSLLLKFYNKIELNNVADDRLSQSIVSVVPNYGYFAFASKLKHDCFANLLPIALNNRVALVALQPIKKGTELTLSYIDHAFDTMHVPKHSTTERAIELYRFARVCACAACTVNRPMTVLSEAQRQMYRRWCSEAPGDLLLESNSGFKPTCDMLTTLRGLEHTPEHLTVYAKFRALLVIYQFIECRNFMPDEDK